MTLRIGKLATRCRVSRGHEDAGAFVDSVAREALPLELFARLGPSLDRQPAVVRLRRLNVALKVDVAELKHGALASAWAAAVIQALHQALARPGEDGTLRRFQTRAAYVAEMIVFVSRGPPTDTFWEFPELLAKVGRQPALIVLDLLLEAGPRLGEVLEELRRANKLVLVLAMLDEIALERVLRAISEVEGGDGALNAAQLVTLASVLVATRTPPRVGDAASRRQAIEVWLQLRGEMPVRGVWYGVRLLLQFLEEPALLATQRGNSDWEAPGVGVRALLPSLANIMARFPVWCERLRLDFQLASGLPGRAASVLEELRRMTPTAAPSRRAAAPLWLRSDCAGLLLLLPIIRRLGWLRLYRDPEIGPRVFQALIAGSAMRLLQPWRPGESVAFEAGLLAGFIEEADRIGVAQILASTPPQTLSLFPSVAGWPEALDAAADALALGLASRVRGFRNADRNSITRHFIRVSGRILIEEKELRIVLEPSPWSVALHISGADDALDDVEWLGGRRVVFVLEGL